MLLSIAFIDDNLNEELNHLMTMINVNLDNCVIMMSTFFHKKMFGMSKKSFLFLFLIF